MKPNHNLIYDIYDVLFMSRLVFDIDSKIELEGVRLCIGYLYDDDGIESPGYHWTDIYKPEELKDPIKSISVNGIRYIVVKINLKEEKITYRFENYFDKINPLMTISISITEGQMFPVVTLNGLKPVDRKIGYYTIAEDLSRGGSCIII